MKKYFAALSTTALICVAPYALAASSTDLTVKGTITPAACMPTLSDGGDIDHGKISASDLNRDRFTVIGVHQLQLTVACDAANKFALNAIDRKPGTSDRPDQFGLGLTNAGEKLGRVEIEIKGAVADGKRGYAIYSDNDGATWRQAQHIDPGNLVSVSDALYGFIPSAVKDVTMDLQIKSIITRADRLTLTDEVKIDGLATFEMKYF